MLHWKSDPSREGAVEIFKKVRDDHQDYVID